MSAPTPTRADYLGLLAQLLAAPPVDQPDLAEQLHASYLAGRDAELFGGSTTKGLPWPSPTDPVAQGADAIRALAEAVDPGLIVTIAAPPASAALVDAYPMGVSLFSMSTAQAAADAGWPLGTSSHVMTIRSAADRAAQLWFRNNNAVPEAWYRSGTPTAWSSWVRFAAADYRSQTDNSAVNISSATWTRINLTVVEFSAGDNITGTTGMTVARAGLYQIECFVQWAAMSVGIYLMGPGPAAGSAAFADSRVSTPNGGSNPITQSGAWTRRLAAGDQLGLWVWQNSGAVVAVNTARRMVVRRVAD